MTRDSFMHRVVRMAYERELKAAIQLGYNPLERYILAATTIDETVKLVRSFDRPILTLPMRMIVT